MSIAKRPKTNSPVSHYRNIQTENVKFEKFMELISRSKMKQEDIKEEIIRYVQTLETNYTNTITELTAQLRSEKTRHKKL